MMVIISADKVTHIFPPTHAVSQSLTFSSQSANVINTPSKGGVWDELTSLQAPMQNSSLPLQFQSHSPLPSISPLPTSAAPLVMSPTGNATFDTAFSDVEPTGEYEHDCKPIWHGTDVQRVSSWYPEHQFNSCKCQCETICSTDGSDWHGLALHFFSPSLRCPLLRPVLLAGRDGEQRWFGGRRDLDYSVLRVWWLHTLLHGKAEAQGTRPSKPEKKGTRPIGNSRGIAVRVGRLLSGSGKALDTFLCPLHESGLVEGRRM